MLEISVRDLESSIASRVLFAGELESQMHSLLEWLNPPVRPMRHHRSSADFVLLLQQIYLPEEKVNLIYILPLEFQLALLIGGPADLRGRESDWFST